jgi:hypothetical protein
MSGIKDYSTTAADNDAAPPNGFPEGMAPASLNDGMRQVMADIRSWYEDPAWINYGDTLTYSSGTVFLVTGNLTTRYAVGRRIRATGTTPFTVEGTITVSTYSAPNTSVTVVWDSGSMDSTLNNVFINMAEASSRTIVGTLAIAGTASNAAGMTLAEDTDNGTNKITLRAPAALASDYSLVLPTAQGSANSVLTNDGSGNLSFSTSLFASFKDKVLNGLILSNNGTDATNDIDVSEGACVSDDGTTVMTLSAITKRLDAAWAVGTGNGGLDTGSIANNTYHVWVINRPDTNVTDVLFSLSASSPTMPTNYTKKKRIGSIIRVSAAILLFTQRDDEFRLNTYQSDYGSTGVGSSAVTVTLASVPLGIITKAYFNFIIGDNGAYIAFYDADKTPVAANTLAAPLADGGTLSSGTVFGNSEVWTNTGSQIKFIGNGNTTVRIATKGWRDPGCR